MVSRAGYTGAWVVAYSVSCSVCVCGGVQKQSMSMRATTRESDGPPLIPTKLLQFSAPSWRNHTTHNGTVLRALPGRLSVIAFQGAEGMEISLLALAPLLFAARAFLALRAEQELHAPSIDADPVVCSQLGTNYSYLSRAQFMLERCPATVSTTCTAQQVALRDAHHDPAECKRWAVSRQCASNPSFMTEQCNASCGELLLQQHAARLRMQLLAVRLAVPAAWQRDDAAANCSSVDASACLEEAERMMRLCPASCLGLGIPDNSSSHSCQLWAQRDECVKNAGYMKAR